MLLIRTAVAQDGGVVLGYAYAGSFIERAAYDRCVEMSIYLDKHARGHGTRRKLYTRLEHILTAQNIINLNACIAYPDVEDEYLTSDSVRFHGHMGYSMAGRFHKCGYKFGRWYDMVWMEKMVGGHPKEPKEVVQFSMVSASAQ